MLKSEFKSLYRQMRMGTFDTGDTAKDTGMQKYFTHDVSIIYTKKEGKETRLYCRGGSRAIRDVIAATIDNAGRLRREKPEDWRIGWDISIDVARDFAGRFVVEVLP